MLRAGIIGYGKMGQIRHRCIDIRDDCEIVAIYDPIYNGQLSLGSEDAIISHPDLDIIFICTPNHLNHDLTVMSLRAGKHTFCEKPPCLTSDQILSIRAAWQSSSKCLMYGLNHRHHKSIQRIRSLINASDFGKVLWMRGRYGKGVPSDFMESWRSQKSLSGGGILMDQGIHMLDLLLYLGDDFDMVQSMISNLYWKGDIEDNAFVNLKNSRTNLVASLHSTMTQWRHLFSLEVFLENGYMVLNGLKTPSNTYGKETLTIGRHADTTSRSFYGVEDSTTYDVDTSWDDEVDHFISQIISNKPIQIGSIDDAEKLINLIEKIYDESI